MATRMTVPEQNQGQIVEVGYIATPSGILRRALDRSDRSESWSIADYADEDTESAISSSGWRPEARDYRQITAAQAERYMEEE